MKIYMQNVILSQKKEETEAFHKMANYFIKNYS